tara:strand:+ start:799 stop:942 length:144 start_codon:yes stop_codon:yes gene_type:complete
MALEPYKGQHSVAVLHIVFDEAGVFNKTLASHLETPFVDIFLQDLLK